MDPSDNFGRESLRGVSATASGDGVMTLVIYPTPVVWIPLIETVIHEYHPHLRHGQVTSHGSDETLLSRLIFEGLAEHFVIEILGHMSAPWFGVVSDDELWELWPKYRSVLQLCGEEIIRFLFVDPAAGLPQRSKCRLSSGYQARALSVQAHPRA